LDLIIYLYVEKEKRIERLTKREEKRFGERIKIGNDMYEKHKAFIEWAKSYEDGDMEMRSRKSELAWIEQATCQLIKIEREIEIKEEVRLVLDATKKIRLTTASI
jgi:hypothetical protein